MSRTRKFFSSWKNWIALGLIAIFAIMAIAAPLISPVDPEDPTNAFRYLTPGVPKVPQAPSSDALLGTLHDGADVFHTLIWGARDAFTFGLSVTILIFIFGAILGTLSAYNKGFLGKLLLWYTDTLLAFPVVVTTVLFHNIFSSMLMKMIGAENMYMLRIMTFNMKVLPPETKLLMTLDPILLSFVFFLWMPYARMMNSSVRKVLKNEYILAAKASGVKSGRIMFRYIIPNAIQPLITMAAKDVGALVVLQSALSYLGMGKGSPWATLLLNGRDFMFAPRGVFTYWWIFVPVGMAIIMFSMAWGLLGDGLNKTLDPKENA